MDKKRMRNGKFLAITVPICVFVLVLLLVLNIVTGIFAGMIDNTLGRGKRHVIKAEGTETWDTEYYDGKYAKLEDAKAAALLKMKEVTDEGMVLLKNDSALPIAKQSKVTPFGKAYKFPILNGNQDGGSIKYTAPEDGVTPAQALAKNFTIINAAADCQPASTGIKNEFWTSYNGVWYQPVAYAGYPDSPKELPGTVPAGYAKFGGDNQIPELKVSVYDKIAATDLAEMSGSTGLVFVSRSGNEDMDKKSDGYVDGTPHYLALSKNERDMIAYAKAHCAKVVLIVNSSNPIELAPVMQGDLEVNAIIWAGHPGEVGFDSLSDILCGAVNPSGRLVDLYATDFLKTPSFKNWGGFNYTNAGNAPFVEYEEGMYNGYRYYETAHDIQAAGFTYGELDDKGAIRTAGEVAYPFGYGLSYTKFTQKIESTKTSGDHIEITVKVTNTGDYSGKDIVQLYVNPPYTNYDIQNKVEKPTATLVAFAKTDIIECGASDTITLTVPKDELASYNYMRDNGDGTFGCYFLEDGDYEFSIRKNSHEIIEKHVWKNGKTLFYTHNNPRPAEVKMQAALDDEGNYLNYPEKQIADPEAKFIAATNLFPYLNEYMTEQTTMLTRADWNNTLPFGEKAAKAVAQKFADMFGLENSFDYKTDKQLGNVEGSAVYVKEINEKQSNGLTVLDMRGKDYYDPDWEVLLDQLDYGADADAIHQIISISTYFTENVKSIGLPPSHHCEGANGVRIGNGNGISSESSKTSSWCMAPCMASTWNVKLLREAGEALGQEALLAERHARYSPAFNLHRSPFQGRVFEYFSEDPLLSGKIASAMVSGTASVGLADYVKHFGLNDQETNRSAGLKTWATEQVVREMYNRPFEICIREARKTIKYTADKEGAIATKVMRGCSGLMGAQNCFGPTTAFANYDLMTKLLREEWNFNGAVVTDMFSGDESFIELTVRAGTDHWLVWSTTNAKFNTDTATGKSVARNALHHLSYMIANSSVLQNCPPGTIIYYDMAPWRIARLTVTIVLSVLLAAAVAIIVLRTIDSKRHPEKYKEKPQKVKKQDNENNA